MKLILTSVLLSLTYYGNAQTYRFEYKLSASEEYKSAKNVLQADDMGRFALSAMRKRMYDNSYFRGYTNKDNLYYTWDMSGVNMSDTDKTTSETTYGTRTSLLIKFGYDTQIKFLFDKKNKVEYLYMEDTTAYDIVRQKLISTGEKQIINGWNCEKWTPEDKVTKGRVFLWYSSDVPEEVNYGIFPKKSVGGLVRIEWPNGRFNELQKYEVVEYDFPAKPNAKSKGGSVDLIQSALFDDYNDSMKSEVKYE